MLNNNQGSCNEATPVWPDWANFRHLGYILKGLAIFLERKFAQRIGEFLGYFWRKKFFWFFHYIISFKISFDVDILRFQNWLDVDIFEFEIRLDVDILALKKIGRLFLKKSPDWAKKISRDLVTLNSSVSHNLITLIL